MNLNLRPQLLQKISICTINFFAAVVVVILINTPVLIEAQKYDKYWSNTFSTPGKYSNPTITELKYNGFGSLYLISNTTMCDGLYDWLGCLDLNGNLKWSNNVLITNMSWSIFTGKPILYSISKDTLLMIGVKNENPIVIKFNANTGDTIMDKPLITSKWDTNIVGYSPAIKADGSILMLVSSVKYSSGQNAFYGLPLKCGIVQLSSNGDVQWEERYDTLYSTDLKVVENNNYISFGQNYKHSACYLTKYSADHHKLWEKQLIGGEPTSLYTRFSGTYACITATPDTVKFAMFDMEGNLIKSWKIQWNTMTLFYHKPKIDTILPDTSLYISGIKEANGGDIVYRRLFNSSGDAAPPCTSDIGLTYTEYGIINGNTVFAASGTGADVYIEKFGINQPPRILRPARNSTINIFEDTIYNDTLTYVDTFPNEQVSLKLLSGAPSGFSLNTSNTIQWRPSNDKDSGNHVIRFEATDRLQQKDTLSYIIHVTAVDDTPVISNVQTMGTTYENDTIHLSATVTDEENEPLKYLWIRNSTDTLKSGSASASYIASPLCGKTDTITLIATESHYRVSKTIFITTNHRKITPEISNADSSVVNADTIIRWAWPKQVSDHKLDSNSMTCSFLIVQYQNYKKIQIQKESITQSSVTLKMLNVVDTLKNGYIYVSIMASDTLGYSTGWSTPKMFNYNGAEVSAKDNANNLHYSRDISIHQNKNHSILINIPYREGKPVYGQLILLNLKGAVVYKMLIDYKCNFTINLTGKSVSLSSGVYVIKYIGSQYSKSFQIAIY